MDHIAGLGKASVASELTFLPVVVSTTISSPPVVRALTMRPEFVTSYTPYRARLPGVCFRRCGNTSR